MNWKHVVYIAYCWISTILALSIVWWSSTVTSWPFNSAAETTEALKALYRVLAYCTITLLTYRSLIASLRVTVDRLRVWRSANEKIEDEQFSLIIETFVVIVSILLCVIVAGIEEYLQLHIDGRNAQLQDILLSTLAIILTGLILYSEPLLGELEYNLIKTAKKRITSKFIRK